jgi:hypothetical protein
VFRSVEEEQGHGRCYPKLFNEDDEVVGCVTLKLLSTGQSYQPAAPFPPGLKELHNKMIATR